eukprot:snap_masked-scaffold_1-processed-gene-16.27-mRNA-1 protein AED:0.00 eAED:0.00 QI:0/-1/0/1/-1/1/1/0/398
MINSSGIMVAATKQHVGKTTSALALFSGLRKRFGPYLGFQKPVGQTHVFVQDTDPRTGEKKEILKVDKDVRLFKKYFNITTCQYKDMSPVVIPKGYTRSYIDGEITEKEQVEAIVQGYKNISAENKFSVVEGTGHCGVGSIVSMDNVKVAKMLNLDMVLVVNGGLGSAFDELALNRALCVENDVKIKGIVINKVRHDKIDMISEYFPKAIKAQGWDFPVLGVVPDLDYLGRCTMVDYEALFNQKLVSKTTFPETRLWHFDSTSVIAMDLNAFSSKFDFSPVAEIRNRTLYIVHSSRNDIILAFLMQKKLLSENLAKETAAWRAGLILTGDRDTFGPSDGVMKAIQEQHQPVLFSGKSTLDTLTAINNYTPKLNEIDVNRTAAAIEHYEKHINFDLLLG